MMVTINMVSKTKNGSVIVPRKKNQPLIRLRYPYID